MSSILSLPCVRLTYDGSAFVHKKDCGSKDLPVGQAVSFVFEQGDKGAAAKNVREEEGGVVEEVMMHCTMVVHDRIFQ